MKENTVRYATAFEAQAAALEGVAEGLVESMEHMSAELRPGVQVCINVLYKTADKVREHAILGAADE